MAYKEQELGLLIKCKPTEATEILIRAFIKSGGHVENAATLLGAHKRSIFRWVNILGINDEIDKIRVCATTRKGIGKDRCGEKGCKYCGPKAGS